MEPEAAKQALLEQMMWEEEQKRHLGDELVANVQGIDSNLVMMIKKIEANLKVKIEE